MYFKKGEEYIHIGKGIWIPCVFIAVVLVSVFTIMIVNPFGPTKFAEFAKLKQGVAMLEENYYEDVDMDKLLDGALRGIAASPEDPYTVYMTAEETQSFMDSIDPQNYAGVGMYISFDEDGAVAVSEPIEGSPAYNAGLVSGDKILSVNGESTENMSVEDVASRMKGKEGTDVVLSVLKLETGETVEITLTRAIVEPKSVTAKMVTDKTGYICINQFAGGTASEFIEKFNGLVGEKMEYLVVDLRNNPGGYLDQAVEIADIFLSEGTIVYTVNKTGKKTEYNATEAKTKAPMVVLVNGNSASASEVLVGALKDYGLATIVGEKTYGKGVTQITRYFADGSMMKITDSKYYTPNGVCIDKTGIEPDVTVAMDAEKYNHISRLTLEEDEQLKKAVEILEQ